MAYKYDAKIVAKLDNAGLWAAIRESGASLYLKNSPGASAEKRRWAIAKACKVAGTSDVFAEPAKAEKVAGASMIAGIPAATVHHLRNAMQQANRTTEPAKMRDPASWTVHHVLHYQTAAGKQLSIVSAGSEAQIGKVLEYLQAGFKTGAWK